ncbi:hypothetical protein [Arthrobacter roseus]|uniref:hypothetical protein n=1 Tax=Arthrobacter roseus TaxID=136274 RepID=UPI0019645C8D|nr:hypothetical protein [Arthrobacter roseus]MBM7848765.1 hypothetical protein [Arthrobacter roseus]
MSEGNGPIPSRKALRQRRVEAESLPESAVPAPEPLSVAPNVETGSSVDPSTEISAPVERESQARARSREALQAYKSLAEPSSPVDPEPPTRRQLRMRRAETAEVDTDLDSSAEDSQSDGQLPSDHDIQAEALPDEIESAEAPLDTQSLGASGGRRHRRQVPDSSPSTSPEGESQERMSIEQALAAREALMGQAQNQAAALASQQQENPFSVDLAVLAEQKALAERAAVLNRRAENMERLSRENEQARSERNDPTTAHNLGMIAPIDYAHRPGVDRSVTLRAPGTTHIPVCTGSLPPVRPSTTATKVPTGSPVPTTDESGTYWDPEPEDTGPRAGPIGAKTAHGLDPLDAVTAAGARIQSHLLMQIAVIGLGAVAIVFGMLMIFGGMGR